MNRESHNSYTKHNWYDENGTELLVTCCDGRCLAEVAVSNEAGDHIAVDILLQSRTELGIPRGVPVLIHRETVATRPLPRSDRRQGRFWIPRNIPAQNVGECYFCIHHEEE